MTYRLFALLLLVAAGVALPVTLSACNGPSKSVIADATPKKPAEEKPAEEKPAPAPEPAPAPVQKAEEKKTEPEPRAEYKLPDDAGGKLVARLVEPTQRPPERETMKPRSTRTSRAIDNPTVPLPDQVASLPRLPDPLPRQPVQPQLIAPEPLFGVEELLGTLPHALTFPAQERVRIESEDIAQPVALPRQAVPLVDRPPLSDPTAEASLTTALTAPLPERTTPAPFQRYTLPDPFENHDTVKLNVPPADENLPDGQLRLPKR